MKRISYLIFVLITYTVLLNACKQQDVSNIKGLKTVAVGIHEWTTQNLNVSVFRNGDIIPEVKTDAEWEKASIEGTPAWCYYNNDPELGKKYGKLYNWYALNDPRGICPEGWQIPTDEEWDNLVKSMGKEAGSKLKNSEGWYKSGNGTDSIGFSALPGGIRYPGGIFKGLGHNSYFWAADKGNNVWHRYLEYNDQRLGTRTYHSLKKGTGMSVRCVKRTLYNGYSIYPQNPPNDGILFIDNEDSRRSSHYGNAITECKNGDILAFYTNVSGEIYDGHGQAGWTEYKRSTDGGQTWGEATIFGYSKKVWDDNQLTGDFVPKGASYIGAYVVNVITAPNGNIVAVINRRKASQHGILGQLPPVYTISRDNGFSWDDPKPVDANATVAELSMTESDGASFVYDGVIYIGFVGGNKGNGKYSFYASEDNGETFTKRSDGLFESRPYKNNYYYLTTKALDDGRFIVYSYNPDDDKNLPYVISNDKGYTWSKVQTTYMEKRIRAGQMSEKIGGYYFMQGRSGKHDADIPWCLLLYTSKDGINWDSGVYLNKVQLGLDCYSTNEVVGKYDLSTPKKLLIQSSISYSGYGRDNVHHWWIENVKVDQ